MIWRETKITSRRNRFWFELSLVDCITNFRSRDSTLGGRRFFSYLIARVCQQSLSQGIDLHTQPPQPPPPPPPHPRKNNCEFVNNNWQLPLSFVGVWFEPSLILCQMRANLFFRVFSVFHGFTVDDFYSEWSMPDVGVINARRKCHQPRRVYIYRS